MKLALTLLLLVITGCSAARDGSGFGAGNVRQALAAELLATGPATSFNMFYLLNGEPTKLGVLTSTGTSVTNATTAVPFTVAAGQVLLFKCDTANANVGGGATCDASVGANHKYQLVNAYDPYFTILRSTTVCLDAPAATTINCAVFKMQ